MLIMVYTLITTTLMLLNSFRFNLHMTGFISDLGTCVLYGISNPDKYADK